MEMSLKKTQNDPEQLELPLDFGNVWSFTTGDKEDSMTFEAKLDVRIATTPIEILTIDDIYNHVIGRNTTPVVKKRSMNKTYESWYTKVAKDALGIKELTPIDLILNNELLSMYNPDDPDAVELRFNKPHRKKSYEQ